MATDFNKLKVAELKTELKRLGLPQNGLKADLVARLDAAAASDTPASDTEVAPVTEDDEDQLEESETVSVPEPTETVPQTVHPAELNPETSVEHHDVPAQLIDVSLPSNSELKEAASSAIESTLEAVKPVAITNIAGPEVQSQNLVPPSSSSATPLQPFDIVQDSQKRKRRSGSPLPTSEDIAAKRTRLNSEPREIDVVLPETNNKEIAAVSDAASVETKDVAMVDVQIRSTVDQDTSTEDLKNSETGKAHDLVLSSTDQPDQAVRDDSGQQPKLDDEATMEESGNVIPAVEELNTNAEPSVHPATAAMYIKNFMRPLRPQAVKDHLLDLATPAGLDIDEQTIKDFYLDNIRTHSFVLFNSVTAAERVRNALHNRVWPDETNRKPLWIDYIPSERFHDWVDMERSSGGGRGSSSRYEVVYNHDHNGNVTADLEGSDAAPPATNTAPPPEGMQSIPTGPSRGLTGIEGAPTGPRGLQGGRAQPHPSRLDRAGDYKSTTTRPSIPYQPVSEELARRRLDTIGDAKSQDYDQAADKNKEYRRYFFENGDHLVDRGPEIFLGIRPPHRERERRNETDRDDRRRGGRGRRNGRRGMPMPHGVPRGGDRYRGPGASSADHDERPRYDDRGGNRYQGKSYGRY